MDKISKYKYNIINQVLSDGSGDWAWTENLIEYLVDRNVSIDNIVLIYLGMNHNFENNHLKSKIDEVKNTLEDMTTKCKVLKMTAGRELSEISYIFRRKDIEEFNNEIYENMGRICDFKDKLYKTDKYMTVDDFENMKNIMKKIIEGNEKRNFEEGNIVCNREVKILSNDSLDVNKRGYPINKISNLINKYPLIKIHYFEGSPILFYQTNLENMIRGLYERSINITFLTVQEREIVEWTLPHQILIREGGDKLNGALNCSIRYGYIQAKPVGDIGRLEEYLRLLNISERLLTCVSYISLSDKHNLPRKLCKFIKIMCYSPEYEYEDRKRYNILMVNEYDTIFRREGERFMIEDVEFNKIDDKTYEAIFNGKRINIVRGTLVSLEKDGFNFAYLLEKTNTYCYLSGDNSYMEGLTLNKKVVHIGMVLKYDMINEIQNYISTHLGITNLINYDLIDRISLKTKLQEYNVELKKYAEYISHPHYLYLQRWITHKNFYETLDINIIGKIIELEQLLSRKKYLKYKQKYLMLKNK